jgi:hypothetical protein
LACGEGLLEALFESLERNDLGGAFCDEIELVFNGRKLRHVEFKYKDEWIRGLRRCRIRFAELSGRRRIRTRSAGRVAVLSPGKRRGIGIGMW